MPTFEDLQLVLSLVESVISVASSADINAVDTAINLKRIKNNLDTGKVRAGVVGLTKSGKSTFLNAILGKQFLPSSIQPQTAREVSIVHNPAAINGELYAVEEEGGDVERIAEGEESISKALTELNTVIRDGNKTFHKLTLNVPLLFLEGVDNANLEISDTPGLYEAAAKNITSESELAVKEMCAFVMILNIQLLKTQSETAVVKGLIDNHPEILSKLSRIMILVNAYDMAFFDDNRNRGSLKPDEIPNYVSNYFLDPLIHGIMIPPEQIIPFSAKWALKSRVWSADPAGFLELKDARILYDEAVIMLERAGYEGELKHFDHVTGEDIETISEFLLEFSHITTIEARLKKMLHENGPAVLLEAAVDDTIAEISSVLTLIETNIELQGLEDKQSVLLSHERLWALFNKVKGSHVSGMRLPGNPVSEINSITESLRGTLDSQISTIFQSHLTGYHGHENRNTVYNRICSVKPLLTEPANNEIQASWTSAARIVRQSEIEHAKSSISALKAELLSSLSFFANNNPSSAELALSTSNEVSATLDRIDPSALVAVFPGLSVRVDGNTVTNDRLNHVRTVYETKWKTVEHRKRKRRGWRRKKKKYYSSEPYQSAIFYPDIAAVKNVFSADATNPWVLSFRTAVDNAMTSTSNLLVKAIAAAMEQALSSAGEKLVQTVEASRKVLQSSREMVDKLNTNKNTLMKAQEELKMVYNYM